MFQHFDKSLLNFTLTTYYYHVILLLAVTLVAFVTCRALGRLLQFQERFLLLHTRKPPLSAVCVCVYEDNQLPTGSATDVLWLA